jgi:hypothetical protein
MINIIFGLLKTILGMKFGWLIAIVAGIIIGGSLIRNILSGSFSVAKFAGGFNIFAGGVQGKLIYYGLIIFACFTAYHFIMRSTYSYDTDYKNQIYQNQDVMLDQRVGTQEGCNVNLFFGLVKIGCKSQPITKIVNNSCDCEKTVPPVVVTPKKKGKK